MSSYLRRWVTLLFCTSLTPTLLRFLMKETYNFMDVPIYQYFIAIA
jgi:hypothetical protein